MVFPSGETSRLIHVPSSTLMSISRLSPGGFMTSHLSSSAAISLSFIVSAKATKAKAEVTEIAMVERSRVLNVMMGLVRIYLLNM